MQLPGLRHTRLPCPSLSPGVCLDSCPLSRWCYLTISSSVAPFSSSLQCFPRIRVFFQGVGSLHQVAKVLMLQHQSFHSNSALTGLISLLSKGLSRVFSSTTIWKQQFMTIRRGDACSNHRGSQANGEIWYQFGRGKTEKRLWKENIHFGSRVTKVMHRTYRWIGRIKVEKSREHRRPQGLNRATATAALTALRKTSYTSSLSWWAGLLCSESMKSMTGGLDWGKELHTPVPNLPKKQRK